MLLKKIIIFLKVLINAKYIFKFPQKKKILLFDDNLEFFLNRCIPKSKYSVLFSRNKNYNLLLILKLLCKFKFSYLNYFNEYIKYVDPKILLTFSDNYPIFYAKNYKVRYSQDTSCKGKRFLFQKKKPL